MDSLKNQIHALKTQVNELKVRNPHITSIKATVRPLSQFAKISNEQEPLLIKGRLLTSGEYPEYGIGNMQITPESLKQTLNKWVGIPIYTTHEVYKNILKGQNPSVRDVIGKIIRTEWNEEDEGIDYYAEVYDMDIANKMMAGLIQFISAGFAKEIVTDFNQDKKLVNYVRNIDPREASLVFNPRDSMAKFVPIS